MSPSKSSLNDYFVAFYNFHLQLFHLVIIRACNFSTTFRSIHQRCSARPATLLKKRLWHRCFPVNFVEFLKTPFLIEYLWATASRFFTVNITNFNNYLIHIIK